MAEFQIAETFVSINGEGSRSGQLACFLRFPGCNLNCSFCDTKWANEPRGDWEIRKTDDLVDFVRKSGVKLITITGGEPLLQRGLPELLEKLYELPGTEAEIETNGSLPIERYDAVPWRPHFTLDCKLPGSGMQAHMLYENYDHLQPGDAVKFVCGSREDLDEARKVIETFQLPDRCDVFLSPVFGRIEPADMVTYMMDHGMNNVRLQLQIHKFIWDPNAKGV